LIGGERGDLSHTVTLIKPILNQDVALFT